MMRKMFAYVYAACMLTRLRELAEQYLVFLAARLPLPQRADLLHSFFTLKIPSSTLDPTFLANMHRLSNQNLDQAEALYRSAESEWGLGLTLNLKGR